MSANRKRQKVLIIEDDFALNDAFSLILQHGGYDTTSTHNGREALDCLKGRYIPDLIILDILMPIMDGREFMQNFNNTKNIPIIALSNLDARSEIEYIKSLGVTRYMLKSTASPNDLIKLVGYTIRENKKS